MSDAQVRQIRQNAERAIRPRYEEFVAGQSPARRRLESMGLDPETYLPSLELPKQAAVQNATPTPNVKYKATNAQEYAKIPPGELYLDADGHIHRKAQ